MRTKTSCSSRSPAISMILGASLGGTTIAPPSSAMMMSPGRTSTLPQAMGRLMSSGKRFMWPAPPVVTAVDQTGTLTSLNMAAESRMPVSMTTACASTRLEIGHEHLAEGAGGEVAASIDGDDVAGLDVVENLPEGGALLALLLHPDVTLILRLAGDLIPAHLVLALRDEPEGEGGAAYLAAGHTGDGPLDERAVNAEAVHGGGHAVGVEHAQRLDDFLRGPDDVSGGIVVAGHLHAPGRVAVEEGVGDVGAVLDDLRPDLLVDVAGDPVDALCCSVRQKETIS